MLEVMFSCKGCGLEKSKVSVRERYDNEGIRHWVNVVLVEVRRRHTALSFACQSPKCDLMIPVAPEGKKVGQK